jgi:hypothetical protein
MSKYNKKYKNFLFFSYSEELGGYCTGVIIAIGAILGILGCLPASLKKTDDAN